MSRKKRTEFNWDQKAQIFARDRATCVYSGKSLWLLDYGASPLYEWNWVDHLNPSRRGGGADITNGVCASYTYNMKKRANGADNKLWIESLDPEDPDSRSIPSEHYFFYFGELDPHLARQLIRLSKIEPSDWYFNQAVSQLMLACSNAANRIQIGRAHV